MTRKEMIAKAPHIHVYPELASVYCAIVPAAAGKPNRYHVYLLPSSGGGQPWRVASEVTLGLAKRIAEER